MNDLAEALIEYRTQLTKAEEDIKLLRTSLNDMLAVACLDGWDKATTGRQIIFRNADRVLGNTRPKKTELTGQEI